MRDGEGGGGLDPRLEQRLRDELDQVRPGFSSPRYVSARRRPTVLRLAPAVLVATVFAMLGLTAYAGSPNPIVWTERVVTVVHPTSPVPAETSAPAQKPEASETPKGHQSPEPSEGPEPKESPGSPEQHESPEPSDGGSSGDGSDAGSDGGTSGDHGSDG